MGLTRKDGVAALLAGAATLLFIAHGNSWLGLGSARWAVAGLLVVGMAICSVGARVDDDWGVSMYALAALGGLALALAALGLVLGDDIYVTALFVVELVLWVGATARHALGESSATRLRLAGR